MRFHLKSLALQFYLSASYLSVNIMSSLCILRLVFTLIQRTFLSSYTLITHHDTKQIVNNFFFLFLFLFSNFAESITNGRMYEPRNIRKCWISAAVSWHLRDALLFDNLVIEFRVTFVYLADDYRYACVLQCRLIKFRHLNKHLNNFSFEKFYVLPRWCTIYFCIVRDTSTGNIMQLSTATSKISQN